MDLTQRSSFSRAVFLLRARHKLGVTISAHAGQHLDRVVNVGQIDEFIFNKVKVYLTRSATRGCPRTHLMHVELELFQKHESGTCTQQ